MKKKLLTYLDIRRNTLNEFKKQYPHYELISNTFGFLFLFSLSLTVWEIKIFETTFIPLGIPLLVWLLPGFILFPFLIKVLDVYIYNPRSPGKLPVWAHLFYNVITWGGFCVFAFMWTNYHFTDHQPHDVLARINSTGHFAKGEHGCGSPYVMISYREEEKQLVFPCKTPVENYSSVHLKVEKGLFGFEVIKDQSLKDAKW